MVTATGILSSTTQRPTTDSAAPLDTDLYSTAPTSSASMPAPSPLEAADPDRTVAPTSGPTTYNPSTNSLVSSQLERLLSRDSPYLDMARTRATQVANRRGLLNSSIAASGGEAAAIGAALPIAQQDAGTFATADRYNADVTNQFAAAGNDFARQNAQLRYRGVLDTAARQQTQDFQAGQAALDRTFQSGQAEANRTWQSGENSANRQFQTGERLGTQTYTTGRDAQQFANRLQEIQAQTESAIQIYDRQNGTKLYDAYRETSQASYDNFLTQVQAIQTSDMEPQVKQQQIAQLQQLYTTRQEFVNTMFAETPRWVSAWSQFNMNFGTPATAAP